MKVHRFKAPSKNDIESQLPFDLSVKARKDYSYYFIGKRIIDPPEINQDREVVKEAVLSDNVFANLRVRDSGNAEVELPVERRNPQTPIHGWV